MGGGGNGDFPPPGGFHIPEITPAIRSTLITVGIALACLIIILIVAGIIAGYVAKSALIRMVNDYEETGEKLGIRQGFRLGWSRTAWRFFLMDLAIGLPAVLAFILLFALAALPLLLWTTQNRVAGVIGTVATAGMVVMVTLLIIIVSVLLSLLMHFFRRVCALEEMGVFESIRQGVSFVRAHLQDVGIMWLIMIGIGLAWIIVLIPVMILLIPVMLVFVLLGGVLGGLPALLVGLLTSLFFGGVVPYIVAGVIGLPIFILVVAAPILFVGGLMEVFKSSTWTLTYRELRALEDLEPGPMLEAPLLEDPLPEPDTPNQG